MHKLRSTAARPGVVLHLVRLATFCTALVAMTVIVIADVVAAETEAPTPMLLAVEDEQPALQVVDGRAPTLLAVAIPDAPEVAPPVPVVEPPKKKKRGGKLRFGRFEGY